MVCHTSLKSSSIWNHSTRIKRKQLWTFNQAKMRTRLHKVWKICRSRTGRPESMHFCQARSKTMKDSSNSAIVACWIFDSVTRAATLAKQQLSTTWCSDWLKTTTTMQPTIKTKGWRLVVLRLISEELQTFQIVTLPWLCLMAPI